MPDSASDDVKAKMREALDRKNANDRGVPQSGPVHEKVHGSEVPGGASRKLRRRKSGES